MQSLPQTHRKRAFLLATGQVTSYGSGTGVDDGALQKGIVKAYTILTTGQYSGTTNITINSKTDVHSNNCVFDNNTGLLWSRYASASVGPASDGKLPWTTTGAGATAEGIFPYCSAANVALLAGYGDWRVPNRFEIEFLLDNQPTNSVPNVTAFPTGLGSGFTWSSSVATTNINYATHIYLFGGSVDFSLKTTNYLVSLVRG